MGIPSKITSEPQTIPRRQVSLADGLMVQIAASVDCLGNKCPRPQLMTKKALINATSGDTIEILIDSPSSMEAMAPMLPALLATHLETVKGQDHWRVYIRKD